MPGALPRYQTACQYNRESSRVRPQDCWSYWGCGGHSGRYSWAAWPVPGDSQLCTRLVPTTPVQTGLLTLKYESSAELSSLPCLWSTMIDTLWKEWRSLASNRSHKQMHTNFECGCRDSLLIIVQSAMALIFIDFLVDRAPQWGWSWRWVHQDLPSRPSRLYWLVLRKASRAFPLDWPEWRQECTQAELPGLPYTYLERSENTAGVC